MTALARRLPDVEIAGLTADSRAVKPGWLFAALSGTQADGRTYIESAIQNGAAAILARPGTPAPVPVVESEQPRLTLAQLAMCFHPQQPRMIAGVTGTNGKTSVARFASQLWDLCGHAAGSLGTLGAFAPGYDYALKHTTPDPVEIHQVLSGMTTVGTTHLAMEVSSHGLAQYRADGVNFQIAAFTNLTRDHFDYHGSFEEYYKAKRRLFTQLLPRGNAVVINTDGPYAETAVQDAKAYGRRPVTVGRQGETLRLLSVKPAAAGLDIAVEAAGKRYMLRLPMIGSFQADNALVAAAIVMESGHSADEVLPLLEKISAAPGRMEPAGVRRFPDGEAGVFVDYAHTPAAVETVLKAIRPHTAGRIHVIVGAGGDRDTAKRSQMGAAAASLAEHVIITDDNPRTEDPAFIRAQVAEGAPKATIIGDREEAIRHGVASLKAGDTLVIAGKGHERGQMVGDVIYPFSDLEKAREALQKVGGDA
ncbi:UDP-N-acetylmuramoyl-L-alanyl-D-glutamate--2,6-diaminopimelate ligase [Parvularcula sp. ZS-1/3]|uniref:UDP-N-acetylmuramoyl-L-alanyl-D-glutamate--2,6-diaminopimelate ligase n=2 Tax=Parvularcula mediterranea TaxID=2732508 RepID=A0A7Y3W418_9PROT|nr:UDP-N-acetylmuramoyl-L-alanyl-D-glutamate--2,6-diaminopimelate ligase [Parvularcula mediterranea]